MKLLPVIFSAVFCFFHTSAGQTEGKNTDTLSEYLNFTGAPPLSCLLTYFPPFLIQHGVEMKSFIRSKTFKRIRKRYGDLVAADAVYIRAMNLTNNNTAVALLLSALACFDHRLVGLKVPIFSLFFPLSDESESEFARRVANLPSKLYSDTPPYSSGDRDKLQHFFGSAFVSFIFESEGSADRVGTFVEKGEDAFIVGGVMDDRDMRANTQGGAFGTALLEDNRHLPSEFIKFEIASDSSDSCKMYDANHSSGVR